jgi:hypothetical protein
VPIRPSSAMSTTIGKAAPPHDASAWRLPVTVALAASLAAAVVAALLAWQTAFGSDPIDLLTGTTLVGVAATLALLPARGAAIGAAALLAAWLVGYGVYDRVPSIIETGVPVSDAVGGAAYFATPYLDQQLAGALAVVVALALGLAVALARYGRAGHDEAALALPVATRHARTLTIVGAALVILTQIPDLHQVLVTDSRSTYTPGWDNANLVTWDYLLQQGLRPMVDFWYPYGGFWLLQDFPTGPIMRFLWEAFLIAVAGWSLWRLAGPRPVRITLCLLGMVVVGLFDPLGILYPPLFWRYVPALVLPVAYAAVGPLRHRRPTLGHGVFAVVCAATAAMEADVFTMGLGGAAFVAVGELAFQPALRSSLRGFLRGLAVDLAPVVAGVAFMVLFWVAAGSLDENVRWFAGFRSVSAYSALDEQAGGALVGLVADPSMVTLLVTIPVLLVVAAFAQRRANERSGAVTSPILLAAAGASAVLLAKHLVRPQGSILLLAPLVALVWTAILGWRARSLPSAVAAGVFLGALIGTLQVSASVKPATFLGDVVTLPATVVKDVGLAFDRAEIHAAADRRFAPERFAAFPEKPFIADKLEGLGGAGDSRFATLGDAQILYVIYHQRPPYHITFYNSSQEAEQRAMISALRKLHPARLVWRRDIAVDGVPYAVRDPLVFAYAIANYVPEATSDPMDVLRRRRPGEPLALRYWRYRLGRGVDLGGIPSYSSAVDRPRCAGGSGCVPYVVVTGKAHTRGARVAVSIAGRGGPYRMTFTTRKDVDRYAIRLDRLWYWPFVRGAAIRVRGATPGWQATRASLKAGDDLY